MYIKIVFLILVTISLQTTLSCPYYPILYGVNTQQPLGYTAKQFIRDSSDCREACLTETNFNCTAFLWPGYPGHCYLFDKVNLSLQIFKDSGAYILYVQSCSDVVPSIGYCEFTVNQTGVSYATDVAPESPGATTEESCFQFCINQYNGFNYEAFIVNPTGVSTCNLYQEIPQNMSTGPNNLWTKNCRPPPKNCEYTDWSEWGSCSATCDGIKVKTRDVKQEGDKDGVPCLDSEKSLTQNCSVSCDSICTYGNWSAWSTCDANCTQTSERELLTGMVEECDTEEEPLMRFQDCTGGDCPPPPTTTTIVVTTETTTLVTTTVQPTTTAPKTSPPTTLPPTTLPPTTTLPPCIYGNWSEWSECDENCTQSRERPLLSGFEDYCVTVNDTLVEIEECSGGLCPPEVTTVDPAIVPEEGCRIDNIDSNSRPSTKFRAVGKQASCAARCKSEAKFSCQAYITAGPGTACLLFGDVTKPVMQVSNSVYYMQDINCVAGKTPDTSICVWEKTDKKVNGTGGPSPVGGGTAYRYYTMDENHCEQLCNMNHPMFRPQPCSAWVYDGAAGFMKYSPNCYLYPPLTESDIGSFESGSGDLYIKKCP
uniref:Apple domain-containing protein n=1 Tax=Strongyloides papillosus TaxID=174720 RepID=A0A0N5BQ06_STREA